MNLSPHVSLDEFIITTHRGIANDLPGELLSTAYSTAAMLERIRDYLSNVAGRDVPLLITSGYRCLELNRAIGSADSSDHIKAMAADWHAPTFGSPYVCAVALSGHVDELQIGQLIFEFSSWVHTSTRTPDKALNRVITIDSTGTKVGI